MQLVEDILEDNIRKCKLKTTLAIFFFLFTYSLKIPHIYKKNIMASAHPHASFSPLLFLPSISSFQSHVLFCFVFFNQLNQICGVIHLALPICVGPSTESRTIYLWPPLKEKDSQFCSKHPPSKNFSARDEVTDASTTFMLQFLPVVILYSYWAGNYSCCQLVWAATTSHFSQPSSPVSDSWILSFLSFVMCPELQGWYGMWI